MSYTEPTPTLSGQIANSGRRVEVIAGTIYDGMTDANVSGCVLKVGNTFVALTDRQSYLLYRQLRAHMLDLYGADWEPCYDA